MPLHPDEVAIPMDLVRGLVDEQFPEYAALSLAPVAAFGTDHRLFRLGDELAVRLPVYAASAGQAETDRAWLPRLAPHLPVELPLQLGLGEPTAAYPFTWSIVRWIEGRPLDEASLEPGQLVEDLAGFVLALRAVDPSGGPAAPPWSRGGVLTSDAEVDELIASHAGAGRLDGGRASAVWQAALAAGPWSGPPVWLHGDLLEGNLLVRDGRLAGVIDFGALAVGDPAADITPAWTLFAGRHRAAYRELLEVDDATWARARAWVLLPALTGITYYAESAPHFAARSRRHLATLLADPTL